MKTKLRKDRKRCRGCQLRPALFRSPSRGRFIAKADGHELCGQCERAKRDRERPHPLEAGAR